jgi:hypothetical protein
LKNSLAALRTAWDGINKDNSGAPLLRKAVTDTQDVLSQIEREHPGVIEPFDLSEKERAFSDR